jgi:hypothetical protein
VCRVLDARTLGRAGEMDRPGLVGEGREGWKGSSGRDGASGGWREHGLGVAKNKRGADGGSTVLALPKASRMGFASITLWCTPEPEPANIRKHTVPRGIPPLARSMQLSFDGHNGPPCKRYCTSVRRRWAGRLHAGAARIHCSACVHVRARVRLCVVCVSVRACVRACLCDYVCTRM